MIGDGKEQIRKEKIVHKSARDFFVVERKFCNYKEVSLDNLYLEFSFDMEFYNQDFYNPISTTACWINGSTFYRLL